MKLFKLMTLIWSISSVCLILICFNMQLSSAASVEFSDKMTLIQGVLFAVTLLVVLPIYVRDNGLLKSSFWSAPPALLALWLLVLAVALGVSVHRSVVSPHGQPYHKDSGGYGLYDRGTHLRDISFEEFAKYVKAEGVAYSFIFHSVIMFAFVLSCGREGIARRNGGHRKTSAGQNDTGQL